MDDFEEFDFCVLFQYKNSLPHDTIQVDAVMHFCQRITCKCSHQQKNLFDIVALNILGGYYEINILTILIINNGERMNPLAKWSEMKWDVRRDGM